MNLDWAVAIFVFVGFTIWSLFYFTGFFQAQADISDATDYISGEILDSIEASEYSIPVLYDSPSSGTGVLHAEIDIPPSMESGLQVLEGSSPQDCLLQSGNLYWESDLSAGENLFTIIYSEVNTSGCSAAIDTSASNQTFPMATEVTSKVSGSVLGSLSLSENADPFYDINREFFFQLRLEWSGVLQGTYGPEVPINKDIHVRETTRQVLGSPGTLDIRILVWE
jgi:hypothetical protein